ncbi:lysis system o-spanin lipoprotein Rz1 [Pseudomonas chlororaphis]|uniref:lysis system o-spanin lipoprotein Rz1 n=1 Tax=Pseudomonas chlororaphis TaxID=587753 RepID=UPI0039B74F8D
MHNVIKVACATVLPLLICACQSFSTPRTAPPAAQCLPPPPPAAWFMEPHAPDLTRRMLNELSASPTTATGD